MTLCIIQARMSSTRLPGKVLMTLGGKSVLEHIVTTAVGVMGLNNVIVATSNHESDEPIAKTCIDSGVRLFRGHLTDVLDRYYHCAEINKAEHIMRLTSDCPFVPAWEIERVLEAYKGSAAEYVSNRPDAYDGHDVEMFSFRALEYTWRTAVGEAREHVTLAMKMNREFYPQRLVAPKLSLDTTDDYDRLKRYFETR